MIIEKSAYKNKSRQRYINGFIFQPDPPICLFKIVPIDT